MILFFKRKKGVSPLAIILLVMLIALIIISIIVAMLQQNIDLSPKKSKTSTTISSQKSKTGTSSYIPPVNSTAPSSNAGGASTGYSCTSELCTFEEESSGFTGNPTDLYTIGGPAPPFIVDKVYYSPLPFFPSNGLLLYYNFSNSLSDSSGFEQHGEGNVNFLSKITPLLDDYYTYNTFPVFSTKETFVKRNSVSSLPLQQAIPELSISFWLKRDRIQGPSVLAGLFGGRIAFFLNGSNVSYYLQDANKKPFRGSAILADSEFHHLALTYKVSGGCLAFYLDAFMQGACLPVSVPLFFERASFAIGGSITDIPMQNYPSSGFLNASRQRYFNGSIDEFMMYNRSLSATEIANLSAYQRDSISVPTLQLSDYAGKVLILELGDIPACSPCRWMIDSPTSTLRALYADYSSEGLEVLTVGNAFYGTPDGMREFGQSNGVTFALGFAPRPSVGRPNEIWWDYGTNGGGGIPVAVIIDRNGIVRNWSRGYKTRAQLEPIIVPLLSE